MLVIEANETTKKERPRKFDNEKFIKFQLCWKLKKTENVIQFWGQNHLHLKFLKKLKLYIYFNIET